MYSLFLLIYSSLFFTVFFLLLRLQNAYFITKILKMFLQSCTDKHEAQKRIFLGLLGQNSCSICSTESSLSSQSAGDSETHREGSRQSAHTGPVWNCCPLLRCSVTSVESTAAKCLAGRSSTERRQLADAVEGTQNSHLVKWRHRCLHINQKCVRRVSAGAGGVMWWGGAVQLLHHSVQQRPQIHVLLFHLWNSFTWMALYGRKRMQKKTTLSLQLVHPVLSITDCTAYL